MKKILMIISQLVIFSFILGACDKDDDNKFQDGTLNYRVKTVSGHNGLWGDYKMVYGYAGSRLDSIVWTNSQGKKNRVLEMKYNVNKIIAELDDIVCMVSADSAAKLDPDSIPYSRQTALRVTHTTDRNGVLLDEHIVYRARVPQVEGGKYSYVYEQTGVVKFLYEYGEDGRLQVWRSPFYGDNSDMVKEEYVFNGQRIDKGIVTVYDVPAWTGIGDETFSYNGNLLTGWQAFQTFPGENLLETKAEYTYSGDQVRKIVWSAKESGAWKIVREVSCSYNPGGQVTKIEYGDGEWQEIEYEDLPGNFDFFLLKANSVYRIPDVLGHLRTNAFVPVTGIR